jgi:DNA-binding response OmpR family regulator
MTPATKRRILCIDDDSDTCELLTVCLGLDGYEVVTATTFQEAARLAKEELFDLYLIDERLPDGEGLNLCRAIRAFDRHTPIVFYSADARQATRQAASNAGAQAFLVKPCDPAFLSDTLHEHIMKAEMQSLIAKTAEIEAMRDEITSRLEIVEEELLKIKACYVFFSAGGARAAFERLWPEAYHQVREPGRDHLAEGA